MDNARTSHRRKGDRRRTVSGALPDLYKEENEQNDQVGDIETMRFPWSSPSAPTSPTTPNRPTQPQSPVKSSSGHKRSFSGNILSKLNFLRSSGGSEESEGRPSSPRSVPREREEVTSPTSSPKADGEVNGVLGTSPKQGSRTRKRTGSLRKTALLGGKKIISEGRERKGSFSLLPKKQGLGLGESYDVPEPVQTGDYSETFDDNQSFEEADSLRGAFGYENVVAANSSDGSWVEPAAVSAASLSLLTDHQQRMQANGKKSTELGSPPDAKSPTSQASTNSDDDVLTFHHPVTKPVPAPLSSTPPASYFPSVDNTSTSSAVSNRRRSSKRRSPLSRTLPLSATAGSTYPSSPSESGHDYTETEYWGWVILFVTWVTFTVGMGSCLGLWSWAWDVGETPYAPPELEDDATLPIVGYYPALIVLTGVVAWVWITVAWVGMKYFRHAKIEV